MKLIKNVIESQSKRDKPLYELALHQRYSLLGSPPTQQPRPRSSPALAHYFTRSFYTTALLYVWNCATIDRWKWLVLDCSACSVSPAPYWRANLPTVTTRTVVHAVSDHSNEETGEGCAFNKITFFLQEMLAAFLSLPLVSNKIFH